MIKDKETINNIKLLIDKDIIGNVKNYLIFKKTIIFFKKKKKQNLF